MEAKKKKKKKKKGLGKAGAWPTRKEENEHAQKWKRMKSRTCMGPEGQVWVWLIPLIRCR
jgi:hypothetical protein